MPSCFRTGLEAPYSICGIDVDQRDKMKIGLVRLYVRASCFEPHRPMAMDRRGYRETYVSRLPDKLNCENRGQAALLVHQAGRTA